MGIGYGIAAFLSLSLLTYCFIRRQRQRQRKHQAKPESVNCVDAQQCIRQELPAGEPYKDAEAELEEDRGVHEVDADPGVPEVDAEGKRRFQDPEAQEESVELPAERVVDDIVKVNYVLGHAPGDK